MARERLNISDTMGGFEPFKPSDETWQTLENALSSGPTGRKKLLPDVRKKIVSIVDDYLRDHRAEKTAAYKSDAIDYLEEVRRSISNVISLLGPMKHPSGLDVRGRSQRLFSVRLLQAVRGRSYKYIPDHGGGDLELPDACLIRGMDVFELEPLESQVVRKIGTLLDDGQAVRDLSSLIVQLSKAQDISQTLINDIKTNSPGYARGEHWDLMVSRLSRWLQEKELPYGVSKSLEAYSEDENVVASPFVVFVRELQEAFPEEAVKLRSKNDSALTQRITLARGRIRKAEKALGRTEEEDV